MSILQVRPFLYQIQLLGVNAYLLVDEDDLTLMAFYLPHHGILFAGEATRHRRGQMVVSHRINTWEQEQACRSTRRLAELCPILVYPGYRCVVHRPHLPLC